MLLRFRRRKLFIIKKKKRKGPLPFHQVLIISVTLFIAMTYLSLYIVNALIKPVIMDIASLETKKVATSTINYSLNNVIKNVDMNKLIIFNKDENGEILAVGFDPLIYSQVQVEAVQSAQTYLHALESGNAEKLIDPEKIVDIDSIREGIIYSIPLGVATKNALFSQLGPKVPVKFTTIGDVEIDLNEEIKHVGINNTWIRVSLDLKVYVEVIIPFATELSVISTTIPIGMIFVPGDIPYFYGANQGGLPSPAVIIDDEKNH